MINIAHISPNQNAYSETFIQSHKKHFKGNVSFYYGGSHPQYLEGEGLIPTKNKVRLEFYIKRLLSKEVSADFFREKALINSFKEKKIDVVYAEFGLTGVAMMNVCKKLRIPLIVNFHGYEISVTSLVEEYKYRYIELFHFATAIIAVSKVMQQRLIDLGCPPEKITYTPCPPDNSFFDIVPDYSGEIFLAIGRFTEKKAPYYTILAFKKVLEKHPTAQLYFAGDGPLFEVCVNLVRYFKLQNNIHLLGSRPHQELFHYYSIAKGFIQHSITAMSGDMEGTPVAILEASAAALPVVSTKHAGIPDVIINNETGLLVDEHDVDQMADKIIYLIENKEVAEAMGKAGRLNIKENFCLDIHMSKLNKVIQNSIHDKLKI
ncbi:glycosyltransferase [Dysgonomonas sp. ZJ279]|uniref:glycosyltransferase n=1 Tax=Dysgonomonas sp. ZJ279 TaxID=2709796 RepID=UPI0013EC3311|nr:glycosyltransferase [Dysgonomonas sp. ZJ279]